MEQTITKQGILFVKEVVARLKGDDNEATALKISRKAISAINGQIAALEAKLVDDENAVEDATEALNDAIYPTSLFSDNKTYCQNIVNAQEKLNKAKEDLESTQASIVFFTNLLANKF